jgi:hypothetical protein
MLWLALFIVGPAVLTLDLAVAAH